MAKRGKGEGREKWQNAGRTRFVSKNCFYGFSWVVYSLVFKYANLKTSELGSKWESVAWSWKNRSEMFGRVEREVRLW